MTDFGGRIRSTVRSAGRNGSLCESESHLSHSVSDISFGIGHHGGLLTMEAWQNHFRQMSENMNRLRSQNMLCDVVLVADDVELPCHRIILASSSEYFNAMFTNELAESNSHRITLQEIDGQALKVLIDFIYTAEIDINEQNVQLLLPAASLLLLSEVTEKCCIFLQSQLSPSNCLGVFAFADLHSCDELHEYALFYTEQHFLEVIQHEEYLNQTSAQVTRLISSDRLSVKCEEQVYEAIIAWVKYDVPNRQQFTSKLMQSLRWQLLSQEFLDMTVLNEPLVRNDALCKDLIIEAMRYHLVKSDAKGIRHRPRTPLGLPKVLLVIGGQAPKAIKGVERYDFKDERWDTAQEMTSRRCRCGVAVVNGLVYAVGGFNGSLRVRSVDVYDPQKDLWYGVRTMDTRRSTLGVAVLNGFVYAVGGFDGSAGLNTVERYDPSTDEWVSVAPMNTRRSSVGVGVVNGLLYAIGGYDGMSRQCLSSVECYNPETDTWTFVAEMGMRRSGAGVGVLDGVLYAVGGHDGPLVRRSVECYRPDRDEWEVVPDMLHCRRNAGVVTYGGFLHVVGGDDGSSNLSSVEYYNDKTRCWALLPEAMITGRSYAGVAVVEKKL